MPACQVVTPLALLLTSPNHTLEDTTYNIEVEQSQTRAKCKKYGYKIDQNVFCVTHFLLKILMFIEYWLFLMQKNVLVSVSTCVAPVPSDSMFKAQISVEVESRGIILNC